jgi:ankyrin repeat protein
MILLESGADINALAEERGGETALNSAAAHGRLDILYLLLKNDGESHTFDMRCEEAAESAAENGHPVIARILREYKKK